MKAALGFVLLAVVAGVLVGLTRYSTSDTIAANYAAAEAAIISELLGSQIDVNASARLCRTEVRGYAGLIRLLVLPEATSNPINADGAQKITAVRVLSHSETPGIGDFIELRVSPWIRGFEGQQRDALDTALDAVSGATITRRAVIKGVANACLN